MNKHERLNQGRRFLETETKKRVAAYCRVSTDKDDQASQQRYFKEYIKSMQGWKLYEIFADIGTEVSEMCRFSLPPFSNALAIA